MKKYLINSENYKIPIIQYGSITDPGGGGGGTGGGGTGGGGDTQACYDAMNSALAGSTTNSLISSATTGMDSAHRYITYTWECWHGMYNTYQFNSVDVGYQQLISGIWQFTSIVHQSVFESGTTGIYVATYSDTVAPHGVVVNPHLAQMTLHFQIRGSSFCLGMSLEGEISPPNTSAMNSFTV